jgi:exosome complex component CSL4
MTEAVTLPGDAIASIEEYEAGYNTYDDGDMVRSLAVGEKILDKSTRLASVKHQKMLSIPRVGDVVIGTVVAVMSSMIAVSIDYINGKPTTSKVECVCSTRNIRKKNIALVNDIVSLKILNLINGTIHATIDEPKLGVLLTKCRKCGQKVVPMRDAIKCTECSWIDERKLSSNFGNTDFVSLRE